ncbi:MAG: alpha/beta fold hydrolase [Planctomycetota bacterium]
MPRRAFFGYRTSSSASSPGDAIRLAHVVEGSGAEAAGLRPDDVIVHIDGARRPLDRRTMLHAIRSRQPGDVLTVSFRRNSGPVQTVDVTLGEFPTTDFTVGGRLHYLAAEVPDVPGPSGPALVRLLLLRPVDLEGDDIVTPSPLVAFVSSMQCRSLDEAALSTSPVGIEFSYAGGLLARGFAVLMVDRPGLGDSQGPPCESLDWDQERAVYLAALHRIVRDPRIDPGRVALLGFGTGGYHAARLAHASQLDAATGGPMPPIRALVAVGVDDRPWTDYAKALLTRIRYPLPASEQMLGTPPRVALTEEEIDAHLEVHLAVANAGLTTRELYAQRPGLRRTGYPSSGGFVAGRGPGYFQRLQQMNAVGLFARVTAPKLFARNEDDNASFAEALERLGMATGGEWLSSSSSTEDVATWLAAELGMPEPR